MKASKRTSVVMNVESLEEQPLASASPVAISPMPASLGAANVGSAPMSRFTVEIDKAAQEKSVMLGTDSVKNTLNDGGLVSRMGMDKSVMLGTDSVKNTLND